MYRNIGDIEILSFSNEWYIKINYKKVDGTWTNYANQLLKSVYKNPIILLEYCLKQIEEKKGNFALYMGRLIYKDENN